MSISTTIIGANGDLLGVAISCMVTVLPSRVGEYTRTDPDVILADAYRLAINCRTDQKKGKHQNKKARVKLRHRSSVIRKQIFAPAAAPKLFEL